MSKPKQWKQGRELKHADAWSGLHYPEEWGPADNRQMTCVCGNPDPGHTYPQEAEPDGRLWVGSGDSQ